MERRAIVLTLAAIGFLGTSLQAGVYDLKKEPFSFEIKKIGETKTAVLEQLMFPSLVRTQAQDNNTVWATFYATKVGAHPAPSVLVLPILGAPNAWIERVFCEALARRGMNALLLEFPYQFHRRSYPWLASGQLFMARNPKHLMRNFRQAVLDARRALQWLRKQDSVDSKRLGVLGVSLGALVGSIVLGLEPDVSTGCLLLGGADLARILWDGDMTAKVARSLEREGMTYEKLAASIAPYDPREHAPGAQGKKLWLINARWDKVVPRAAADALYEALGRPHRTWVWGGHYSAILHMVWMPRSVSRFFQRSFEAEGEK